MKKMMLSFVMVLCILCILSGCITKEYKLTYSIDSISKIEVVDIGTEKTLIATFTDEDISRIITEFEKLPCSEYFNDPCRVIEGRAIIIYYVDDTYEIITSSASAYYQGDNIRYRWEYFDSDIFNSFIEEII